MIKTIKWTHWFSVIIDRNTAAYINCVGIEYIPKKVLNKIKDKSIIHNIFRIQSDDSTICWIFYIAFIEYMLAEKALVDYTDLFSMNDCKKKDKIIYKHFKNKNGRRAKSWVYICQIVQFVIKKLTLIKNKKLLND